MGDSVDQMEVDWEDHTPPTSAESSGKRKEFGSQEKLTPRKRPRTSFWPSKRLQDDQEVNEPCDVKLADLKAGCRSLPVKVRVVYNEVRAKYRKMAVMDSTGEKIVKAFSGCIDQFRHIEENKLYQLDGYNVQAGYQGSPDEIVLQSSSTLTPIDSENFPEIRFDFKPLQDLCTLPENTSVDVVGIITSVGPVSKNSKGTQKRELVITDTSKTEISVFFWRNDVERCDDLVELSPIILRSASKKAFGVLWCGWKTQILKSPSHPKNIELMNWFHEEAISENIQILSCPIQI